MKAWSLVVTWRWPVEVSIGPELLSSATFCCMRTLSSMLCGWAPILMLSAFACWVLAPALWLTPSAPLPLLKASPWMLERASIAAAAGVFRRWRICVVALASGPTAKARALACCCWSPAAWLTDRLPR
ncbi:hypothetical protein D9M71_734280 [compost metagenome]